MSGGSMELHIWVVNSFDGTTFLDADVFDDAGRAQAWFSGSASGAP